MKILFHLWLDRDYLLKMVVLMILAIIKIFYNYLMAFHEFKIKTRNSYTTTPFTIFLIRCTAESHRLHTR